MTETPRAGMAERVQHFLQWFAALEPDEQDVLMTLVQREKKVRDVVKSLGEIGRAHV